MVPDGAVDDIDKIAGRISLGQMVAGEPVLDGKLGARDAGRGLAALVPKGMRAYTLVPSRTGTNPGLNAALSVAGFILPGNKVDVLLNLKGSASDDTGGGSTTTLLQSIEVLAVDQKLDAPADNKNNLKDLGSVTLLVTPDQAALLDLGENLGQLSLSLRNLSDTDSATTSPAKLIDIRGRPEKANAAQQMQQLQALRSARGAMGLPTGAIGTHDAPAPPDYYHIMTIRGVQQDDLRIPAANSEK
jgi:pilus assembly protein CpaB